MSSLPAPPGGLTDKHAHLVTYGVLAALLVWGLTDRAPARTTWASRGRRGRAGRALRRRRTSGTSRSCPGAKSSALDLAADAAGAAIAAVALRAWAIIRARR